MLLNLRQAAQTFGVSVRTVRRRVISGQWPSVRLGARIIRVDPDEILRLGSLVAKIQSDRLGDQQKPGRDKSNGT
jgi:predicted DNA-binding transcriptional regulator AlpA